MLQTEYNNSVRFLSTPSARRATSSWLYSPPSLYLFLSTPSARRATGLKATRGAESKISIHALREEGDAGQRGLPNNWHYFYPRPPRGGRLFVGLKGVVRLEFLSTPSARRATHRGRSVRPGIRISIHALREEGDLDSSVFLPAGSGISIHALREEGDSVKPSGAILNAQFLSTPSARRATTATAWPPTGALYFYPRPPRGGRQHTEGLELVAGAISIHALREEGDRQESSHTRILLEFLSTPSARRATSAPGAAALTS